MIRTKTADLFDTDEKRFLAILHAIENNDYDTICIIDRAPYFLDLYAKRFEELIKDQKLPNKLQYAEIRCLVNRKDKQAYNEREYQILWNLYEI